MGISFGQGLAAFAGGALDRAKEVDKEVAARVKTLKASKPDELLKTRYKKEYDKYDKEQAILDQVSAVSGGADSEKGQMLLLGVESQEEYRKMLQSDPKLYAKMRVSPNAPKYKPTDYNLSDTSTASKLWASMTGDSETANKPDVEVTPGTTTSYRRGTGTDQTAEGRATMDAWRKNLPDNSKDEKEYQFKWRKHQENFKSATDTYKDDMETPEAKKAFAQLATDGRTLIYGKDGKDGQTDWQKKLNLHMLDTPKRADFEQEDAYASSMSKWKHGYNILKLGSGYDNTTDSKEQVVAAFDAKGNKVKAINTGNENDNFGGIPGWKKFGGSEKDATTSKTPTLQKTYDRQGNAITIQFTGSNDDTFDGRPGWVQVGSAQAAKPLSVSEKKWAPIQVIVDAINEGRTVTQAQLNSAEFITRMTKDAIPLEYHKVLDTWNLSTMQVRDYSALTIKVNGVGVPATTANISAAASEYNMSVDAYKKQLYTKNKPK